MKYDERYDVSPEGIVTNTITGNVIKPIVDREGYHKVTIFKGKNMKSEQKYIHRLVAELYVPKPEGVTGKLCVYHKNGDKTDNRAANLGWKPFTEIIKYYHGNNVYSTHLDSLKKKVCMIDPNDSFKSLEFDSFIEAAVYLKSTDPENLPSTLSIRSNISAACDDKRSLKAYGYIWKTK